MYRKSSRGNPYHDAKGRFTSAGDRGAEKAVMWSAFGDQQDISDLNETQKQQLDAEKTNEHINSGQRFYHKRSINREQRAKNLAFVSIPKGLSREERTKLIHEAQIKFRDENKVAIRKGAKVIPYVCGNDISFQVVETGRMVGETLKKSSRVTRNTSTSMKPFSGFTVEYYADNEVRSCKQGASAEDAKKHLSKFCQKYKKKMTNVDVCIKAWRDKEGRLRYMPTYHFASENDAKTFAAEHKGARVVNHDDGSMA